MKSALKARPQLSWATESAIAVVVGVVIFRDSNRIGNVIYVLLSCLNNKLKGVTEACSNLPESHQSKVMWLRAEFPTAKSKEPLHESVKQRTK